MWYTVGGKSGYKNLEQWININICVNVGRSANEILAQLILAYG
jgi:hypothetical protein